MVGSQKSKRLLGAFCLTVLGLGAWPVVASAARVGVEDQTGDTNHAFLLYQAAPGETNRVAITIAGKHDSLYTLNIVDSDNAVEPGAGCSGGGPPGQATTCTIHMPTFGRHESCGHDCVNYVTGTRWEVAAKVDLGDGDDALEASTFTDLDAREVDMVVDGGTGADTIATGAGDDRIDPGSGSDAVHSGAGNDQVEATASPDGPDLYDLDSDGNQVSYARRNEPVLLSEGVGGAAGENDVLIGVGYVIGGSAGDSLSSADGYSVLEGRDGDDFLTGGNGDNRLYGGAGNDSLHGEGGDDSLLGGDGDDAMSGGEGDDVLFERVEARYGANQASTTGTDTADGGPGNDLLFLGPGADNAEGGQGNDEIYGEGESDRLAGGPDNDTVAGESGPDQLWGGAGEDRLLAGRTIEQTVGFASKAVDTWRDHLHCGADRDKASLNPWDRATACESISPVRLLEFQGLKRYPNLGRASLRIGVFGPGQLALRGRGVSGITRAVITNGPTQDTVDLPIRPRGKTAKALRRRGQVTVPVTIRFQPTGGIPRSRHLAMKLVQTR